MLTLELDAWKIEIPLRPCAGRQRSPVIGKWLSSLNPPRFLSVKREQFTSTTQVDFYSILGLFFDSRPSVKHRPHEILVSIRHDAPAYLDEIYPITIEVTNLDDKDLDVTLDILLQPTDVDGAGKKYH